MSKFSEELVDDYAKKLLIELTREENKMVLEEFDYIDENINLINQIDNISSVEPMTHALDDFSCELRKDEVEPSIPIEDLLKNADDTDGREIEVVKVVG